LIEQIRSDLDASTLLSIGRGEYSIWKTPEGTLYIDSVYFLFMPFHTQNSFTPKVLAKKKDVPVEKGKDAALRKWDAELRQSLATKKPANANNLSKQDKALVDAQLAKEAQVRARVEQIKNSLERGLHLIRSIIKANPSEFQAFVEPVTTLLLSSAIRHGSMLVGNNVFETYVVGTLPIVM